MIDPYQKRSTYSTFLSKRDYSFFLSIKRRQEETLKRKWISRVITIRIYDSLELSNHSHEGYNKASLSIEFLPYLPNTLYSLLFWSVKLRLYSHLTITATHFQQGNCNKIFEFFVPQKGLFSRNRTSTWSSWTELIIGLPDHCFLLSVVVIVSIFVNRKTSHPA